MATVKKIATPIDIDRYLKRTFEGRHQRVNLLGIELEGLWSKLPEGVHLTHDGSVRVPPPSMLQVEIDRYTWLHNRYQRGVIERPELAEYQVLHQRVNGGGNGGQTGELPSPPIEVSAFPAWMKIHYPQHVNGTCGLHVHMSFKSALHYQRLMVPEYQSTILKYIDVWAKKENLPSAHPIWERLSGKSRYCQHKFYADLQARRKGEKGHDQNAPGHRYTAINYAYGRFQTVECRLLPMFTTVEQSIRSIQEVIQITNAFLLATKKEPTENAFVGLDDPLHEEVREYYL